MKYDHLAADILLIDGPVSIHICRAPQAEIAASYARLFKLVRLAAEQLGAEAQQESEASNDLPRTFG